MRLRLWPLLLLAAAAPALAEPGSGRGYYRFPAIHGDTVVFTSEGDLWRVGVGGGVAQRLTASPVEESRAAISPDGATLAFSAAPEGPTEVYTMPLAGGVPVRQTWEGDALVVGWTPDGKVLYATRARSTLPEMQLVALDPVTHATSALPLAQASDGCYDRGGGTLFFTRMAFQGSHTKRYKGGTAQNVWSLAPGAGEAAPLTADYPGTSKTPMWWKGRVYFASDRDGTMNLWSMDERGRDLKQLTRHAGWDVQSPALDAGRIVYQLGADLHVYDIAAGKDATLAISLASDFGQLRERWVDKPLDYLTAAHLAPGGDRVVLTARGEVFVAPVKQGRFVEATRTPGVRYRQGRFMPDGKSLVALSDQSGEVEWWRLAANGVGAPEQLTRDGAALRFDGLPSPDGAWIASYDKNLVLWLYNVAEKRTVKAATARSDGFSDLAWSPDSKWLAYVTPAANTFGQIQLYNVGDATTTALTDDRTESASPAWSPDGKWIYFLSDRHLESAVRSPWGPREPEPFFAKPTKVYAAALTPGQRFPFLPGDELHAEANGRKDEAKKDEGKKDGAGKDAAKAPPPAVPIERAGLAERVYEVPVEPGDYEALAVNGDRLFWLARDPADGARMRLLALAVTNKDPKPKTLAEGVRAYELSADGKKVLVRKDDALAVFDASADKPDLGESAVGLKGWRFPIAPREELAQMFREAWRLERDYFWDRGMSGLDWPAIRAKYQPLADRVTDRAELSDVLGQMVSELGALHIFVYGGDMPEPKDEVPPASLGAVLAPDEAGGGLRVVHVYRADPNYPDRLAPLARPGVEVRDGDLIEAIDGAPVTSVGDAAALLRDKADRQVLLRVRPAGAAASRDVIVTPITPDQASGLRYDEWELTRRERVERLGKGEIGYVHLRAMGGGNYAEWARSFYPVFDRAGLVVDVRHNRGGNIDSWILEKLMRKAWFYWQPRLGDPSWNMQYAFRGHAVVLVDQRTASDGEAFAEGFRRLGLGKVIGMRTWGGEVWLSSSNVLVDKGIATACETGVYGPEGQWLIEGHGVEPDLVVDDPPGATFRGEDAQLDEAVRVLQQEIREHPVPVPPAPRYPDRTWKPPAR